jgi:rare lipoprotein A
MSASALAWRAFRRCAVLALTAGGLAACAGPSGQYARHGNEFFSVAKYGPASPRVVADGDPVPRGGGQYLVGHPYTIAGRTYYPRENPAYSAVGMASWYGDAFNGRRTANGEVYDMRSLTAAHPTMPLPSYARVTNLVNGYSIIVRVNDRGPYASGRIMDVSSRVADVLDFKSSGTGRVKVDYVGPAPIEGSDDAILLASLRTNGTLASLNGPQQVQPQATVIADADPASPRPAIQAAAFQTSAVQTPAAPRPADLPMVATTSPRLMKAPPPPPRPFDLGAIARILNTASVTPPRRPVRQAFAGPRALYFTAGETPASRLLRGDPFAGVLGAQAR